jgi:hypothetical protein
MAAAIVATGQPVFSAWVVGSGSIATSVAVTGATVSSAWSVARMVLCDVEHDRPRLEQNEITFLISRNLPERMKRPVCGFLHLGERNEPNVIWLAGFFQRPANAHVARQSLAAIGRPLKRGNNRGHWKAPGVCMAPSRR